MTESCLVEEIREEGRSESNSWKTPVRTCARLLAAASCLVSKDHSLALQARLQAEVEGAETPAKPVQPWSVLCLSSDGHVCLQHGRLEGRNHGIIKFGKDQCHHPSPTINPSLQCPQKHIHSSVILNICYKQIKKEKPRLLPKNVSLKLTKSAVLQEN